MSHRIFSRSVEHALHVINAGEHTYAAGWTPTIAASGPPVRRRHREAHRFAHVARATVRIPGELLELVVDRLTGSAHASRAHGGMAPAADTHEDRFTNGSTGGVSVSALSGASRIACTVRASASRAMRFSAK